jgi:hypothetical protein
VQVNDIQLCLEPPIYAFGVEYVVTDGNLAHLDSPLEFLEADNALELHVLVDPLVIALLLDQGYDLVRALIISWLWINPLAAYRSDLTHAEGVPEAALSLEDLLTHLPPPDAQSNDRAHTDAHEGHHEHEENQGDHSKYGNCALRGHIGLNRDQEG